MNLIEFWKLIEVAHASAPRSMDRKCRALKTQLEILPLAAIADFIDHFDSQMDRAYSWPLWGAAYIIGGGCSDDSFMDFRATLISFGRRPFEAALEDPESLLSLGLTSDDAFYEGFGYVASALYEEKSHGAIKARKGAHPREPSGRDWDEDDLPTMFPKLWKKYS